MGTDTPPRSRRRRRLGEMLTSEGLITQSQLDKALELRQVEHGKRERVGQTIVRLGLVDESVVAQKLAEQFGFEFVPSDELATEPGATILLPPELARRHRMLPLRIDGDTLSVVCADPADVLGRDDVRLATGFRRIQPVVSTPSAIDGALRKAYGFEQHAGEVIGALEIDDPDPDADSNVGAVEGPVVKLVDSMIAEAVDQGASDIHIEPTAKDARVRYRIDGVLQEASTIPRAMRGQLAARVKIMGSMDVAERRLPQDGRARFMARGSEVDLRISTLPSLHGETVVIRLLRKGAERLELEEVGFDEEQLARVAGAIERPQGLILITGPTGSGKTSTLYAILERLVDEGRNIVTLEDPIEYELPGVNQTQVMERIGRSFARCLRTVLRQDPDIVMVGEIRDQETAELALQAAMTGHLVLSTLHTNDAPSAVVRLIDLGVPPYLVSNSLTLVAAQRLVRTVCEHCAVETTHTEQQVSRLRLPVSAVKLGDFRVGVGCSHCNQTGYRGRAGLFEVLPVDGRIRELVAQGASTSTVRQVARSTGMRSLRELGIQHALEGRTTLDELLRVIPQESDDDEGSCLVCGHVIHSEYAHCPWCAAPLGLPTCESCNRPIELGWRVCPGCGDSIVVDHPEDQGDSLPRLLVVDDDDSVRAAIEAMVAGDYEVTHAVDGTEALAQLHREAPDVVLVDIGLPDMDGFALTRQLRARKATMDLPVVIITGSEDRETELEGLQAGADDHLTKPLDPDVLLARIKAVRRRRHPV